MERVREGKDSFPFSIFPWDHGEVGDKTATIPKGTTCRSSVVVDEGYLVENKKSASGALIV